MAEKSITRRNLLAGAALASAGLVASAGLAPMIAKASENEIPDEWDYDYDIVVCGAGGAGLIASLKANDEGCSVIDIDANFDIGGHAITSRGTTHSGGGTSAQIAAGIEDSPDRYYMDHTDPRFSDSCYNDREVIRGCADYMVECYEWMLTKGLKTIGEPTDVNNIDCETIYRAVYSVGDGWTCIYNGKVLGEDERDGTGVTRPFEAAAREQGVDFMMNRHMDALIPDDTGRIIGIRASYTPRFKKDGTQLVGEFADGNIEDDRDEITIHAKKAVIVCTGGGSGNLAYRTMFNPNWGPQMDGCAGEPWSFQDASGEIAGMAIGAGFSSTANWTYPSTKVMADAGRFGCRYNYNNHFWDEGSPVWDDVGGKGFVPITKDGMIYVNMLGKRFYDETKTSQDNFYTQALGSVVLDEGTGHAQRVGGPIWAIFDSDYVDDNMIDVTQPEVDIDGGYFFSGETLEELANNIINKYYEDYPMDPDTLVETVQMYNTFVESGEDTDFGRSADNMTKKIERGPFYAAWATPNMHDCTTGLATDGHRQVKNYLGELIPGLYAAGECAGGHRAHGLGKTQTAGYIAGLFASQETPVEA